MLTQSVSDPAMMKEKEPHKHSLLSTTESKVLILESLEFLTPMDQDWTNLTEESSAILFVKLSEMIQ